MLPSNGNATTGSTDRDDGTLPKPHGDECAADGTEATEAVAAAALPPVLLPPLPALPIFTLSSIATVVAEGAGSNGTVVEDATSPATPTAPATTSPLSADVHERLHQPRALESILKRRAEDAAQATASPYKTVHPPSARVARERQHGRPKERRVQLVLPEGHVDKERNSRSRRNRPSRGGLALQELHGRYITVCGAFKITPSVPVLEAFAAQKVCRTTQSIWRDRSCCVCVARAACKRAAAQPPSFACVRIRTPSVSMSCERSNGFVTFDL